MLKLSHLTYTMPIFTSKVCHGLKIGRFRMGGAVQGSDLNPHIYPSDPLVFEAIWKLDIRPFSPNPRSFGNDGDYVCNRAFELETRLTLGKHWQVGCLE